MLKGTIVCGVDDSREATSAAAVAAQLARRLDLRLVLVHVVEDVPSPTRAETESLGQRNAATGAARLLVRVADAVEAEDHDGRVEFGDPAERLAEVAAEEAVELVVLGARRRRLAAAFGGGLSTRLAESTDCPVVVVPRAPATARAADTTGMEVMR